MRDLTQLTREQLLVEGVALQNEIRNLRELLNDSDPEFYGSLLPLDITDDDDLEEEYQNHVS